MKLQKFQKFSDAEIDKQEENETQYINKIMDGLGFTRYHYLIFIITALILICGGVQELMLSVLLSLINEKENLNEYHLAGMNTTEYLGYTTASILVNVVTQYISTRRAILAFTFFTLIFTGLSISNLIYSFAIINRFFIGICLGIVDILAYINLIEYMPTKIRGFVSSLILIFFPLGQSIIAVFCYFQLTEGDSQQNFIWLLLTPFIVIAFIVVLLIFIQESPRRYILLDDIKGGVEIIQKISNFNKDDTFAKKKEKIINDLTLKRKESEVEMRKKIEKSATIAFNTSLEDIDKKMEKILKEYSRNTDQINVKKENNHYNNPGFKELFLVILNPNYLRITTILWILASLTGFIFNGIFFILPTTAPKLEKEVFKSVILSVGIELPSNFFASLLIELKFIGRIRSLLIGYICCLGVCIVCFYVGYDYLIINCLLKFFITIPSNILTVYGSEIYDSKVRTFGTSAINFWKRIATVISPFVVSYLEYSLGAMGPYFAFLPCSLLAVFITFFLNKETRGIPLDEIVKRD